MSKNNRYPRRVMPRRAECRCCCAECREPLECTITIGNSDGTENTFKAFGASFGFPKADSTAFLLSGEEVSIALPIDVQFTSFGYQLFGFPLPKDPLGHEN